MDRLLLFPTPIYVFDLPDMEASNRELAGLLLAERDASPGLRRSNVGGWHSAADLSDREAFSSLIQRIVNHAGIMLTDLCEHERQPPPPRWRYAPQAWAMVMEDGDCASVHHHGGAHWSSVYYVDAGDTPEAEPDAGRLVFVDPRPPAPPVPERDLFRGSFSVAPRTAMLVIFPGWLQHYVQTYRGRRPRISVSCNLVMRS